MQSFSYTPDSDLKVHHEGALRLICQGFRSHDNGLPEWCKNSSDAYIREGYAQERRSIVLIFQNRRGPTPATISCLDFVGMTSQDIERRFRHWADPNAVRGEKWSADLQGGHGNGGKCYMTQMFEDFAYLRTMRNNRGNVYGVQSGSFRFGYIPDAQVARDSKVGTVASEVESALKDIGVGLKGLPEAARVCLEGATGYTLIVGVGPKDIGDKIPAQELIESITNHPQMIRTLQLCNVFAVIDGRKFNQGKHLTLPEIPPMDGASEPKVVVIPQTLSDPRYNNEVSTTNDGKAQQGILVLKTSDKSMRWKRQYRHSITYKSSSGYIGAKEVPTFGVTSSYADRIYGECTCECLDEYKTNERRLLADSPVTRAIEKWIAEQIDGYAREFELRDKRKIDQQEKNAVARMNEALDLWKNKFLKTVIDNLWGPGSTSGIDRSSNSLPHGKVARLEVSLSHARSGVGVPIKPSIKFFDKNGKRIRPVPYKWFSEDTNVAMVDEALLTIGTYSFGTTQIYAETLDGKIRSNSAQLEVVHIFEIAIMPEQITVHAGGKGYLTAICKLNSGEVTSDIYLVWTEGDSKIARVSPSGMVFGFESGETIVSAGDNHCLAKTSAKITVVPPQGTGEGNKSGRGFPLIRISEIDPDPDTGEEVRLGSQYPPVYQRVQDVERNIWWINSAAPFARMYLDVGRNYGSESREWRIYVLERYLEVMVKIVLNYDMAQSEDISFENWIQRWDETAANMQQFASESLSDFIESGRLPGARE